MKHQLLSVMIVAVVVLSACEPKTVDVDTAYRERIQNAWVEREARLVADDGWLTVVGLFWLTPGIQTIGSAPESDIQLPDGAPPAVGALELTGGNRVIFSAEDRADIAVNGGPAQFGPLRTDADGGPDLVQAGRITFYLIQRGDRIGVRVKDPQAPARQSFHGLDHFPIDPASRVTAVLEGYPEPMSVAVPTEIGEPTMMLAPGLLHFELHGQALALEPYITGPDDRELFIVFRDATSGESTYGGGRFLSATLEDESDEVVLDFNLAINPPCAFTPYATCPLATPDNTLPVPIEAGERYSGTES
jgi:hypothetical protein